MDHIATQAYIVTITEPAISDTCRGVDPKEPNQEEVVATDGS